MLFQHETELGLQSKNVCFILPHKGFKQSGGCGMCPLSTLTKLSLNTAGDYEKKVKACRHS